MGYDRSLCAIILLQVECHVEVEEGGGDNIRLGNVVDKFLISVHSSVFK